MTIRFAIDRWAAWAPGLADNAAWRSWLAEPSPLTAEGVPALAEMPAMMRRRVERIGRVALQAAYWCQADAPECQVVFASRYGDVARSIDMLCELAKDLPLSPTAFNLSVHNAVGALYSIVRGYTGNYTAIGAGEETAEAAFTEALGLLGDGAPAVMVVVYDEPLPVPYVHFREYADFPRAWACRLTPTAGAGFSLGCVPGDGAAARAADLPPDL